MVGTKSTGGTYLMDTTPLTRNALDYPLLAASTVTDDLSGVSVTLVTQTNGTAQVAVDFP